jgi:hypothetical protein
MAGENAWPLAARVVKRTACPLVPQASRTAEIVLRTAFFATVALAGQAARVVSGETPPTE